MLPHDVIRAAAKLIEEGGHSQGCHARDAQGREVALFGGTRGADDVDTSRASINGAAVAFSIYGALAAVMRQNPCNPTWVWVVVRDEAEKAMAGKSAAGGTNHVHPVALFNEHMDTDKAAALAFLERCALALEPIEPEIPGVMTETEIPGVAAAGAAGTIGFAPPEAS